LAAGLILGAFLGYLNCAQQIFQEVYHLGRQFPFYMAILALSIGSASYFNSRFVMRWGMRLLSRLAMQLLIVLSVFYFIVVYWMGGHSPLWMMTCLMMAFFCIGILFGNLNAIAMAPLGHIAGVGAAVVGSLSSLVSVPLAIIIGRSYDGTTLPLIGGFAILSVHGGCDHAVGRELKATKAPPDPAAYNLSVDTEHSQTRRQLLSLPPECCC
jgi:DHA1 family bicyclomycin/chloramphenicol resistance-like MFS transporter